MSSGSHDRLLYATFLDHRELELQFHPAASRAGTKLQRLVLSTRPAFTKEDVQFALSPGEWARDVVWTPPDRENGEFDCALT